jgi:GTP-binding protein
VRLRVLSAEYWVSGSRVDQLPPPKAPEIAFVGRSNVGKSSLLNALVEQKHLVRTSRTPGQTRNVNLFRVTFGRVGQSNSVTEEREFVFADLPGYGYAKMSGSERERLGKLLSHYLADREGLTAVVQLVDARHLITSDDKAVYQGLHDAGRDTILVATKVDRIASSKRKQNIKKLIQPLGISPELVHSFSSTERIGREELLTRLWDLAAK